LDAYVVDVPLRPSCVDSLAGWRQSFPSAEQIEPFPVEMG